MNSILPELASKASVINNSDLGTGLLNICNSDNQCLKCRRGQKVETGRWGLGVGGWKRSTSAAFPKLCFKVLTPSGALRPHGS